jgi:predicted metal-dependent phosphoesterase TrpH
MVRHGAVPDYQTAFDEYLAKGAKGYVTRKLFKPREATELMARAGVVPVLAHPFTLNLPVDEIATFVDELVDAGLKGIEGYHGDWSVEDQAPLRDIGERNGLIVSGGSDYHGDMRPDRGLPGGKRGVAVPDDVLDKLRDAAGATTGKG